MRSTTKTMVSESAIRLVVCHNCPKRSLTMIKTGRLLNESSLEIAHNPESGSRTAKRQTQP